MPRCTSAAGTAANSARATASRVDIIQIRNRSKTCTLLRRALSGLWGPAAPLGPVAAALVPRSALLPAPTPRLKGPSPAVYLADSETLRFQGVEMFRRRTIGDLSRRRPLAVDRPRLMSSGTVLA